MGGLRRRPYRHFPCKRRSPRPSLRRRRRAHDDHCTAARERHGERERAAARAALHGHGLAAARSARQKGRGRHSASAGNAVAQLDGGRAAAAAGLHEDEDCRTAAARRKKIGEGKRSGRHIEHSDGARAKVHCAVAAHGEEERAVGKEEGVALAAGLEGVVEGRRVLVTGRKAIALSHPGIHAQLPPEAGGLECVVVIDDAYAGTLAFRDEPRQGAREFIEHLSRRHGVIRTLLISGDRASEVEYLADRVGLDEAHASVSPEEKLAMVRAETMLAPTVFLGDGINDAPAMTAATVGVAFGKNNDVTAEAASAVVLDSSLDRLDELMHIGRRMRRIALQTAIGGIVLSCIGMVLAVFGLLPPIAGAVAQEAIDVLAILNASRVAMTRKPMSDFRA